MIEPKEHNIRPYRELCEMLEKHGETWSADEQTKVY